MKIFAIFAVTALTTFLGYWLASKYIQRKDFFNAIVFFANLMEVEVGFSQKKTEEIINENIKKFCAEFQKLLTLFIASLNTKKTITTAEISNVAKFLKNEEIQEIFLFFNGIGKYDSENQIKNITSHNKQFVLWQTNAKQESNKYVKLYVKLGFLLGLIISIIIM
ncbi:MAG: stage III sporulation protein AB [Clostridia bacterium]